MPQQERLEIDESSSKREYWNQIAVKVGFGDIKEFLNYFESHSQTPVAKFSSPHAELAFALAGYSPRDRREENPHYFWQSLGHNFYEPMKKKFETLE